MLSVSKYSVKTRILVEFLDDHLKKSGIVQGMSGSPIYFDGKIAGALAFGWNYAKDPIAGVTPIEEMYKLYEDTNAKAPMLGFADDNSLQTPLMFSGISSKAFNEYSSVSCNKSSEIAIFTVVSV